MSQWNPLVHKPLRCLNCGHDRDQHPDGPCQRCPPSFCDDFREIRIPSTTPHPSDGLSDAEIARSEKEAESTAELLIEDAAVSQALAPFLFGENDAVTGAMLRALSLAAFDVGRNSVDSTNDAERIAQLRTDLEKARDDLRMVAAVLDDAGVPERSEKANAPWHVAYRVRMLADRKWQPEPFSV